MQLLGRRLRLLPATILMLTLLIPVQLNVISKGVDSLFVRSAATAAEPAKPDHQADKTVDKTDKSDKTDKAASKAEAKPVEEGQKSTTKDAPNPAAKNDSKDGDKAVHPDQAEHFDPTTMSVSEMEMLQSLSQRRGEIEAKEKTINDRILFL